LNAPAHEKPRDDWRQRRGRRERTRAEKLLASADYRPLLKRLEKIVENATQKPFRRIDRAALKNIIAEVFLVYDGTQFLADLASRVTLHEIKEPLAQVIKILKHEANYDAIFVALGAPTMLAMSPDQRAVDRAVARYETLLDNLEQIARAAPPPPTKRGRGKPPARDLRVLVQSLADYWERATRRPLKQNWHRESSGLWKPTTNGTMFVYDAVKFIDSKRLGALKEITEDIVTKRRRAVTSTK
jgi:hypothetical protein